MERGLFLSLRHVRRSTWVTALCLALVPILPDFVAPLLMPMPLVFLLAEPNGRAWLTDFFHKKDAIFIWSCVFVAACALGCIWSGAKGASVLTTAMWLACLTGAVGIGGSVRSRNDLHVALLGLAAGGVVSSVLAIFQLIGFRTGNGLPNPLWVDLEKAILELVPGVEIDLGFTAKRACGGFTNSGVFGFYLVTVIPAVCLFAIRIKNKLWHWAAIAALVLCCAALFGSYSRMSYITLLAVMTIVVVGCAILRYQKDRNRHPAAKWWLLGALVALPVLLVILAVFLPESVTKRFFSAFSSDNSIRTRWALWTATGFKLADEPMRILYGYGTGVQPVWEVFRKVQWLKIMGIDEPHAHNLYLQLLMEGGLIRLVPFCGLCVSYFLRIVQLRRGQGARTKVTLFLLACCLVALLLNGLTDYVFVDPKVCFLFFGLMGLGLGLPLAEKYTQKNALTL